MALNPSVGDAQRTLQTTNCDEAANAPEVDTAVLAPEWRGENAPPESHSRMEIGKSTSKKVQVPFAELCIPHKPNYGKPPPI
ncbi:MAG: hypothetical protein Q9186_006639 [Xanthomendoza sp. 1 TL-2023]